MKHCIASCLVLLAGLSAAWGQIADVDAGSRGIPKDRIGIALSPDGTDEVCDDEDELTDVVLGCRVTKVTTSLDGPVPFATFWGTFCDGPTVFAGQTDGTLQPLLVLSASPSFVTVDLTGNDDPADVVFKIECPCETCDYKLTLGSVGPTGPTGPVDPAVVAAICEIYSLTGNPLPAGLCGQCIANSDCDDSNDCTSDECIGSGTSAICSHTPLPDGQTCTPEGGGTGECADGVCGVGPADPVPVIVASPPGVQSTGLPVLFDGSQSTFDPSVEITCFEWTIASSIPANDEVVRAPDAVFLTRVYGEEGDTSQEQDLAVQLRVSDDPGFVCDNATPPPPGAFGPNVAQILYQIRCDVTLPIVDAGPDRFHQLPDGFPAIVVLTATAFDPEDPDLDYVWDCGNGTRGTERTVTCAYDTVGVFVAVVTVQNDCGLTAEDSLVVTIVPLA